MTSRAIHGDVFSADSQDETRRASLPPPREIIKRLKGKEKGIVRPCSTEVGVQPSQQTQKRREKGKGLYLTSPSGPIPDARLFDQSSPPRPPLAPAPPGPSISVLYRWSPVISALRPPGALETETLDAGRCGGPLNGVPTSGHGWYTC